MAREMARSFLFGLGSFFVLLVFAGLWEAIEGAVEVGAIEIVIGTGLSLGLIRTAQNAPIDKSRFRRISAWLIGFFAFYLVAGAFYVAALIFNPPAMH